MLMMTSMAMSLMTGDDGGLKQDYAKLIDMMCENEGKEKRKERDRRKSKERNWKACKSHF